MKKYLVYLAVTLTADLLAVICFFRYIHISWASIAPGVYLFLTLIMTPAIAIANSNTGRSLDRMENFDSAKRQKGLHPWNFPRKVNTDTKTAEQEICFNIRFS